MLTGKMSAKFTFLWLGLFCTVLLLHIQSFSFSLYGNLGFVALSHALSSNNTEDNIVQAERLLRRAAESSSKSSFYRGLALTLSYRGQTKQAIQAWQNVNYGVEELIIRGNMADLASNYAIALDWYLQAASIKPTLSDSLYYAGLAYQKLGQFTEAEAMYNHAIKTNNFLNVGPSDVYLQVAQMVVQHTTLPDWESVQSMLEQALQIDDFRYNDDLITLVRAHYSHGEALRQLGRYSEAMDEYVWVIDNWPYHYWAHYKLGNLIWKIERNAPRAETLFLQAIEIRDDLPYAYMSLGAVYQDTGNTSEALRMYRYVLQLDANHAAAREAINAIIK